MPRRPIRSSCATSRFRRRAPGLWAEPLEHRCLLSQTFVVNTLQDQIDPAGSPTVSLRDAITQANSSTGGATITFAPGLSGAIRLSSGQFEITGHVTLSGPGAATITIDGLNQSRIFQIDANAQASISGLTITGGYAGAANNGGAILNNGTLSLSGDGVSQSTAGDGDPGSPGGLGGGIYNASALFISASTISGNVAGAGGRGTAGVYLGGTGGSGGDGGGIYNAGMLTLVNSTLSGNAAGAGGAGGTALGAGGQGGDGGIGGSGGGLANALNATLVNDTISENSSGPRGPGGIGDNFGLPGQFGLGAGLANLSGTLNLGNTIAANNFISSGDVSGAVTSEGHNLVGQTDTSSGWTASDQTGTAAAPLDPKLAPLALYGGSTPTYAFMNGSPALDAGDNTLATNYSLTTDQRGLSRVFNTTVDVGAYEAQPSNPAGDVTHDGTVNLSDFLALTRNFGATTPIYELGDVDGNGVVNLVDLVALIRNFGRHTATPTLAAAPLASANSDPATTASGASPLRRTSMRRMPLVAVQPARD